MAFVRYTARRSLAPSHVVGLDYTLELDLTDDLQRGRDDIKETPTSIAGQQEVQWYGAVIKWDCTIAPVQIDQAAWILEFLDSTADGQDFEFDPYGIPGHLSPAYCLVIREDKGYDEKRFMAIGQGGGNDFVQYSFKLRQV